MSTPASPPVELLRSLSLLYSVSHPLVRAAFVALCTRPDEGIPATLLVAIDVEAEEELVLRDSSAVVRECGASEPMVDLAIITGSDSKIARYFFTHAMPFYERITSRH